MSLEKSYMERSLKVRTKMLNFAKLKQTWIQVSWEGRQALLCWLSHRISKQRNAKQQVNICTELLAPASVDEGFRTVHYSGSHRTQASHLLMFGRWYHVHTQAVIKPCKDCLALLTGFHISSPVHRFFLLQMYVTWRDKPVCSCWWIGSWLCWCPYIAYICFVGMQGH